LGILRHAHTNAGRCHRDADTNANEYSNAYTDSHANSDGNKHSHEYTNGHRHNDANGHKHRNTNSHGNSYQYAIATTGACALRARVDTARIA
jgi:hypothetical protein